MLFSSSIPLISHSCAQLSSKPSTPWMLNSKRTTARWLLVQLILTLPIPNGLNNQEIKADSVDLIFLFSLISLRELLLIMDVFMKKLVLLSEQLISLIRVEFLSTWALMIWVLEETQMRPWDLFKVSNMLNNMVKFAQPAGNQAKKPWNQLTPLRRPRSTGRKNMPSEEYALDAILWFKRINSLISHVKGVKFQYHWSRSYCRWIGSITVNSI